MKMRAVKKKFKQTHNKKNCGKIKDISLLPLTCILVFSKEIQFLKSTEKFLWEMGKKAKVAYYSFVLFQYIMRVFIIFTWFRKK